MSVPSNMLYYCIGYNPSQTAQFSGSIPAPLHDCIEQIIVEWMDCARFGPAWADLYRMRLVREIHDKLK